MDGRAGPSERCVLDLPIQNVLLSTYFVLRCGLDLETEKTRSLVPMEPRTPNGDNSW